MSDNDRLQTPAEEDAKADGHREPKDPFLAILVKTINESPDWEIGVTLHVNGVIISGLLCSMSRLRRDQTASIPKVTKPRRPRQQKWIYRDSSTCGPPPSMRQAQMQLCQKPSGAVVLITSAAGRLATSDPSRHPASERLPSRYPHSIVPVTRPIGRGRWEPNSGLDVRVRENRRSASGRQHGIQMPITEISKSLATTGGCHLVASRYRSNR